MPRKQITKKRPATKDPVFGSEMVSAYVNDIMRHGKKSVSFKIVKSALGLVTEHFLKTNRVTEEVFQKTVEDKRSLLGLTENETLPEEKIGLVVLHRSMDNTRPHVEMRSSSNRVGGDIRALAPQQGQRLARSFMKKAALARRSSATFKPGDKGMAKLLALEWIDAYDGKGAAVKMCADMHRMAKANQSYVYNRTPVGQESLT